MFEIQLRRQDTSQAWGFRLRGGVDQGIALHVEHCPPKGRAAQAGLRAGDRILAICKTSTANMSHMQIKQEILRAGNDVDFIVERDGEGGTPPSQPQAQGAPSGQEPRVQVIQEPTVKLGGPTYKEVTPKTYQVLKDELPAGEAAAGGAAGGAQAPAAGRPASIFDRKRQERSGYLQAKGPTIQKAYGQSH